MINNNDQQNPKHKSEELSGQQLEKKVDALLKNIDSELSLLETQEILNGLTGEELEEKGFIGNNKIHFAKGQSVSCRECKGLLFEKNIEWADKENCKKIDEVNIDDIENLPDVIPGQLIAVRKLSKEQRQKDAPAKMLQYEKNYRDSNIIVSLVNDEIRFVSKIKGKVVFLNSQLFVISCDRDARLELRISCDKMTVFAKVYSALGDGKPLSVADAVETLHQQGVTSGIKEECIKESLEKILERSNSPEEIVVAEGCKPIDGGDAEIEFFFSKEQTYDDFKILPDGRIDYRKQANIQIVHKGDVLAKMGEPKIGVDGVDVTGSVLKYKEGNKKALCAGENVSASQDEKIFTAETDGLVSMNGTVLSVFQNYVVEGDVDYGIGNIDFNGNITIKGNIRPGFEVKASGDIIVFKSIESAIVIAGRDIRVFDGIIGGHCSMVSCGRDLYVHHLQNATIEVQGNVIINNSSIQSSIFCNKKVIAKVDKGTLVGGEINALDGLEVKTLGSESCTKTRIIVGNDFLVQKTIEEIQKAIDFYKTNITKIDTVLRPLVIALRKGKGLKKERNEKLVPVLDKRRNLKKRLTVMEARHRELEKQLQIENDPSVKVKDTVFPDVFVKIKDAMIQIREPRKNVTIRYCVQDNDIVIGPY